MKYYWLIVWLCLTAGASANDGIVEFMKKIDNQIEHIDDPTFYATKKYNNKTTNEKTSFSDLTEIEKKIFYIWQSEVLSKKLLAYEYSIDDAEFDRSLLVYRKKLAQKQETMAARIFKEIGDDIIPPNDKMSYLKQIHRWNDEHHLIDRDKHEVPANR